MEEDSKMTYDNINAKCYNCLHFWNIGGDTKGKCTDPRGVNYGKVVDYADVCDLFDPT